MKLADGFKPHLCASDDATRYVLNHVSIEGDLAVATNGRILICGFIHAEEGETQTWGLVPKAALELATKRKTSLFSGMVTLRSSEVRVRTDFDSETTFRECDGDFPNWHNVIPNYDDGELYHVGLNAKFLMQIAKAFGTDEVEIALHTNEDRMCDDAMIVTCKQPDRFAILMPLRGESYMPRNVALKVAKTDPEDRRVNRKANWQERQDRSKQVKASELTDHQKAALEWANRHGIQGSPLDLFKAFEDARTFQLEGGAE